MTNVTQSLERLPCIVIIDSLHRISCGIVIIHLTIAKHRDVIFTSSVGYDSSSHQPFRKEAVTNQIASRSLAYQLLIYQCLYCRLHAARSWKMVGTDKLLAQRRRYQTLTSYRPQKDCSILPYLVIIHYTNVHCAFYATQIT